MVSSNHLGKDETQDGFTRIGPNADLRSMHELVINLSRAHTVKSMADTVANYCGKVFQSPAGAIFVERNGNLEIISQWRSRRAPKKHLAEEIIKNGPAARAFRTGKPIFCRTPGAAQSSISRYLHRLLRRCRSGSATFLPIRTSEQQPVGVLGIILPYVEEFSSMRDRLVRLGHVLSGSMVRARAYDEALAARTQAENAIHSKDEFLSMLSHELKNPMMPILGWAVALSSGTLPADKQNVALEGIVRNVRALNYLVEDLFDAARITSGKLRLELGEIRIQDVAREALAAIQHAVESKKLRISTDISEAIPPFMADAHRLQQVLMNLLNNAVKFTPGGGSIALRIRRFNDNVECIVSDTGKGIERKFLPFVFERFRQEHRSSKVHAAGLGLGLAIVREIAELHGGSIEAWSEGYDKGSTFILRLPLRRRRPRAGKCVSTTA
jgi:signal transduction histidine kinase